LSERMANGKPRSRKSCSKAVTARSSRVEAVPVKHGVDRAGGGNAHLARQPPDQELADLTSAPMRLLALPADDQALDLRRQPVGVAYRPPRAIAQRLQPMLLVAVEELVAGLPRNPECPAGLRHRLAVQQPRYKPQALVHYRTASTPPATHAWQEVSPMCPVRTVTYISERSRQNSSLLAA
jgi:hypothetical protein